MSRLSLRFSGVSLTAAALFCATGHLQAHCRVESPNGGEVLRVGSQVTIKWRLLVRHPQKDWDLWYSTTGLFGTWIPIKMDMPVSQTSLVWTVPNTISTQVRFRIRQDNFQYDTYDISDRDCTIAASLSGSPAQLSVASAGTQTLGIDLGVNSAKHGYWVAGSVTGTKPGIQLGDVLLPLKYDVYTAYTVAVPNSALLSSSKGILDETGRGKATFNLPKGLPKEAVGVTIHHAFLTYTGTTILGASNPVSVKLVK